MSARLELVTYGKAVIVKGDTMPIKDFLKEQRGSWNRNAMGWCFPGSKKASLLEALRAHSSVKSVDDKTSLPSELAPPSASKASSEVEKSSASKAGSEVKDSSAQKRKTEMPSQGNDDGFCLDLGNLTRVSISTFKGKSAVDVRKFFVDKSSNDLLPTPKGVRLDDTEWTSLRESASRIDQGAADSSKQSEVDIGDLLLMTVKDGRFDLRRLYIDKSDGERKPTKKGVSLSAEQWTQLKSNFTKVEEVLRGAASSTSPSKMRKTGSAASELEAAVRKLLQGKDLQQTSLKQLRRDVEVEMKLKEGQLDDKKDELKRLVTIVIQESQD